MTRMVEFTLKTKALHHTSVDYADQQCSISPRANSLTQGEEFGVNHELVILDKPRYLTKQAIKIMENESKMGLLPQVERKIDGLQSAMGKLQLKVEIMEEVCEQEDEKGLPK
ncbi:hypothetical protein GUJ93_ZPchr0001g29623 [Zizania palustris]|uniref:Uncharacterized protein n=1 Tax=Zizania palustris TaxID=103762 RepID=A0A8J5S0K0_ZIZPA|nr:hypothetical protein GUJ93_ZPchr0001g29623 [Zizania palustris]